MLQVLNANKIMGLVPNLISRESESYLKAIDSISFTSPQSKKTVRFKSQFLLWLPFLGHSLKNYQVNASGAF